VTVTDSASNTASAAQSITVTTMAGLQPTGPSGTWTLAWNDEFNNAAGMSGSSNGLSTAKWNVGFYDGPSSPGGAGYRGLSKTASSGADAIEFYGPGAISFPSGGGMEMSCYASGDGPDGASYSISGFSSTSESGMVNTAGLMCFTCNTGYSVPSAIASTVIQAANICIEVGCQMAGPNAQSGGYWQWIGSYNCGDCSTPDYPNSGEWTEEIDVWEELGNGNVGSAFEFTMHAASSYGSVAAVPSSLANTDLSLATHKYTIQYASSAITVWVDGTQTTTVSPTSSEVSAQFATPQYLGIALQLVSGYVATGTSGATPMTISYVRVFTQS
jgi:Glycosyl hydrolases family 16